MREPVASVANSFVDAFAPVSLWAFGSTELTKVHLSGGVRSHYGCVSQFLHRAGFLPLTSLRAQIVIHGVLASRILFNLRQSRETSSVIIGTLVDVHHIYQCQDQYSEMQFHPRTTMKTNE